MTTINCSSNCKHQHDGKCMLENAISQTLSLETDCAFFEKRPLKYDSGCNYNLQND